MLHGPRGKGCLTPVRCDTESSFYPLMWQSTSRKHPKGEQRWWHSCTHAGTARMLELRARLNTRAKRSHHLHSYTCSLHYTTHHACLHGTNARLFLHTITLATVTCSCACTLSPLVAAMRVLPSRHMRNDHRAGRFHYFRSYQLSQPHYARALMRAIMHSRARAGTHARARAYTRSHAHTHASARPRVLDS